MRKASYAASKVLLLCQKMWPMKRNGILSSIDIYQFGRTRAKDYLSALTGKKVEDSNEPFSYRIE